MKRKGILIVVSGFSGAGKGTVMKQLLRTYDNYALSVSMTTRKPRPCEVEGRDYFFTTREEFEQRIAADGLIEYAGYCGNYYGTPGEYVEKQLEKGKDVVLEIEIQGAVKIKKKYPQSLLLFVMPPSVRELERRLMGRGTESREVVGQRLLRAMEEAKGIDQYDFIIINDKLEECVRNLHSVVEASRYRPDRNEEFINQIRQELDSLTKGDQ